MMPPPWTMGVGARGVARHLAPLLPFPWSRPPDPEGALRRRRQASPHPHPQLSPLQLRPLPSAFWLQRMREGRLKALRIPTPLLVPLLLPARPGWEGSSPGVKPSSPGEGGPQLRGSIHDCRSQKKRMPGSRWSPMQEKSVKGGEESVHRSTFCQFRQKISRGMTASKKDIRFRSLRRAKRERMTLLCPSCFHLECIAGSLISHGRPQQSHPGGMAGFSQGHLRGDLKFEFKETFEVRYVHFSSEQ